MDGTKLKQLRKERGYSLTKLSKLSDISKSYLSLIERDIQTNPSLEILEKIATSLGINVEELVKKEKEQIHSFIPETQKNKSILKVEIELSGNHLNSKKIKQINDLIKALNSD